MDTLLTVLNDIDNLSDENQIKVVANFLGYKSMPPSVIDFIEDPYYLGEVVGDGLYPFWKNQLREIFPSPIHTKYPIIVVKGGIGTGKSTFARVCAEYMKCRLGLLKDPWKTCNLIRGKNLKFAFFHKSASLAGTDFIDVLDDWESSSPFFKDQYSKGTYDKFENAADSTRTNNVIGSDVVFFNFSELNFIPYDKAFEKLDLGLKRWDSRFNKVKNYFGMLIVDTSSQGDDSIADDFANNNPYGDMVKVINTNQWLVRAHENYYGRLGWFKVYCGDSINQPFIVTEDNPIKMDMDRDRLIDVPMELYPDFKYNLVTALQDKAGISTTSTDKFYANTEGLVKCLDGPQFGPDIVTVDFFDKYDKLIYKFGKSIDSIPSDRIIFIRYDVGVVSDNTGLAIAYFDGWEWIDKSKGIKLPRIKVPLAVGVSRLEGQETSISHLFEFVMDLSKKFEIGEFTADQFQSRQILQDLTREKIPNSYLSVDRTDESYVLLKTLTNSKLISLPNNSVLKGELSNLKRVGNKIDHPVNGCFTGEVKVRCMKDGNLRLIPFMDLINCYEDYQVISYDPDKKFHLNKIKTVAITKKVNKLIKLVFSTGHIFCTEDHKFLTHIGWVEAKDLVPGMRFISLLKESLSHSEVIHLDKEVNVYDLEVDGPSHNFCLGNGVVAHNSKDIADAVAGVVKSLYNNIEKASQISNKKRSEIYSDTITRSYEDIFNNRLQDSFSSIFGDPNNY